MPKIAIIGAGGFVFPLRLTVDILSYPELQDCTLYLHDIDPHTLRKNKKLADGIVKRNRLPARIEVGTSLGRALDGADYVIVAFQVGGIPAYTQDVEIPRRYGVDQCVGDTLGPGGVFRGLRSIGAFQKIAAVMKESCPDALMLQYANPMAINCWALDLMGVKVVGLCHSVQGTTEMLAHQLGIPYEEVTYRVGGINHQAWITEFRHRGRDVYPRLREVMDAKCPSPIGMKKVRRGRISKLEQRGMDHKITDNIYYYESVRSELMRSFGYFQTESSHHGSEYVPWFRKDPKMVRAYLPWRWDYYEICKRYKTASHQGYLKKLCEGPLTASHEYGSGIIHSCETGVKRVIYGNVPNWGDPGTSPADGRGHHVTNLPRNSCVEIGCLVDRNGVQPLAFGDLPPACAAVNRLNINVQELAVKGGLAGDRDLVYQAVALDPYAGARLTLPQIRSMVEEMFRAESRWLPQFKRR